MSANPNAHTDQIESNRKKIVELCAAIERECLATNNHHLTAKDSEEKNEGTIVLKKCTARVLIIDDSKFARGVVRGFLEAAGHSVDEASNGIEGLERFSLSRPDLVLTDIVMDGIGGLEVLDHILAIDPRARVIIASSNLQLLTRQEALKRGAVALITKPINEELLKRIVEVVMTVVPGPI